MNRLQKNAFLASAGIHGLLVIILLVGSALMPRPVPPVENPAPGFELICRGMPGSESPESSTGPADPRPLVTPVNSGAQKSPERPVTGRKSDAPVLPRISLVSKTRVVPNAVPDVESNLSALATGSQQERFGKLADHLAAATGRIGTPAGLTTIDGPSGSSLGSALIGNYAGLVKQVYSDAWKLPAETANEDGIVKVNVVIHRDGTVKAAKIIGASGDSALDASIRRTLQEVRFVAAFPANATESELSFTIRFSLRAKRGLA